MCFRPAEMSMKTCAACGTPARPIDKVCKKCGAELDNTKFDADADQASLDAANKFMAPGAPAAPAAPMAPGAPAAPAAPKPPTA